MKICYLYSQPYKSTTLAKGNGTAHMQLHSMSCLVVGLVTICVYIILYVTGFTHASK